MSSKAAASALFGLGADLKIRNIVLELVFAALPTIYMSKFKLLDPSDEMIVDILFQYVKSTLKERGEYAKITQGIVLETFPNIDLASKNRNELALYGDIAIKRQVYKAVQRIYDRIYLEENNSATKKDPSMKKSRILDFLFATDADGIKSYFSIEKLDKLSFLDKDAKPRAFQPAPTSKSQYPKYRKYFRNPSTGPLTATGFSSEASQYRGVTYCFEPYIRVELKEADDIIACSKEANLKPDALASFYRELYRMYHLFILGNLVSDVTVDNNPFGEFNAKILNSISGMSFVCSPADLVVYIQKRLYPSLTSKGIGTPYLGVNPMDDYLSAAFKNISLGVRLSLDLTKPDAATLSSSDELTTSAAGATGYYIDAISEQEKKNAFAEKTVYYAEPQVVPSKDPDTWDFVVTEHFTTVLAKSEQKFEIKKDKAYDVFTQVIDAAAQWKKINSSSVYGTYVLASSETAMIESLFAELLKKKEVDALVKSVLTPILLFNTINLIPNMEIGKEIIPIFRKSGAFRGIDEGVNALISSLENYLSGDFPWLSNCSDVKEIL